MASCSAERPLTAAGRGEETASPAAQWGPGGAAEQTCSAEPLFMHQAWGASHWWPRSHSSLWVKLCLLFAKSFRSGLSSATQLSQKLSAPPRNNGHGDVGLMFLFTSLYLFVSGVQKKQLKLPFLRHIQELWGKLSPLSAGDGQCVPAACPPLELKPGAVGLCLSARARRGEGGQSSCSALNGHSGSKSVGRNLLTGKWMHPLLYLVMHSRTYSGAYCSLSGWLLFCECFSSSVECSSWFSWTF